jgi:hypothetical protein
VKDYIERLEEMGLLLYRNLNNEYFDHRDLDLPSDGANIHTGSRLRAFWSGSPKHGHIFDFL